MTRNPLITAVALGIVAGGACLSATPAGARVATAVMELFTSQGCSSCPPADELFAEYAKRPDVLALSFNVDYWDYLGWKDTLATHDNSERQRGYAAARGDGQVYTPQVVVDGRSHVVGSDRDAIDDALEANASKLSVPIVLTPSADAISVSIGDAPAPDTPHATLWLVMYEPAVTVPVKRGENNGRTLTYHNVVKRLRPVTMWKGKPLSIDLPLSEITHANAGRCAVFLQAEMGDGLPGPVLGAATLDVAN